MTLAVGLRHQDGEHVRVHDEAREPTQGLLPGPADAHKQGVAARQVDLKKHAERVIHFVDCERYFLTQLSVLSV